MNATYQSSLGARAHQEPFGRIRVLVVHNRYQQAGGEDSVFEAEVNLLRRFGHEVQVYERHNEELKKYPAWRAARDAIWSPRTLDELRQITERFQPQVVHVHNTFPLISPSVYWAAERAGAAVVQTLHNYRLLCPEGFFQRNGKSCEDCLGRLPWRAITRHCYRTSHFASAALTAMLAVHRAAGTFQLRVARYIALTEFARQKFIDGGLPAAKIVVKPNFVDTPPVRSVQTRSGGLFVGRLTAQKGVLVLLEALRNHPLANCIRVIGDGPLAANVRNAFADRWIGTVPQPEVLRAMRSVEFLIVPSLGYEGFPRIIVEAYACGLPVIASRLGPLANLVIEGQTGLLFEPGDPLDLARALDWAVRNPHELRQMGARAMEECKRRYSAESNYRSLYAIYQEAMREHARSLSALEYDTGGVRSQP